MKCQILFSGKNKKNISKCLLLKILPRVLSIKIIHISSLQLVSVPFGSCRTSFCTLLFFSLYFLILCDHSDHSRIFVKLYEGHC